MIKTDIFKNSDSRQIKDKKGPFSVIEYSKLTTPYEQAANAYFAMQLNLRRKIVTAELDGSKGVLLQAGAMKMMLGDIQMSADIKGGWDFIKKAASSAVTKESLAKPKYTGSGILVLEPTFKHILLEDLRDWKNSMVIEDGLFLACEDTVDISIQIRKQLAAGILGGEGWVNSKLSGSGIVALESPVPREELVEIELQNDAVKIDGNYAIAWSSSLDFTIEKASKSLLGSAVSSEGLVNVYRGTGKILAILK